MFNFDQNRGLNQYLLQVYLSTFVGIFITLFTANYLATSYQLIYHIGADLMIFSGIILSFGATVLFHLTPPTLTTNTYSINPLHRWGFYMIIAIGLGMVIAPVVELTNALSPDIYLITFLTTIIVFGSASVYALFAPTPGLLLLGTPLFSFLSTLLLMNILSQFSFVLFGFNTLNLFVNRLDVYGGLILFTVYVVYDTYKAIVLYEHRNPDHLAVAIELYLDFMNIFVRLLEIVKNVTVQERFKFSSKRTKLY